MCAKVIYLVNGVILDYIMFFFVKFCPPQRSLHERENILNNYAQCTHTTTKALHNSQQNVVVDLN